jgi:CubicO group peptidase (beta-lactamase class C family)
LQYHAFYNGIMKKIILLVFVFALHANVFGQADPKFRKIDSLMNYFYANNKFMGALTIRDKNNVVFEKTYGFANLEQNVRQHPAQSIKLAQLQKCLQPVSSFS